MRDDVVDIIRKRRYLRQGWEIDLFEDPLSGLVIAEFEMPRRDFPLERPPWIQDWIEVTESLSNRLLARLARDLADSKHDRPIRDLLPKRIPRIVLTGGPCSGKSAALRTLRAEIGDVVHCVPEVATVIMSEVGVKPPSADRLRMRSFQRTIYRVQLGFETISDLQAVQDGREALLLDRGTMDGAAYMDGGAEEFEKVCRTTVEHEYAQYDLVVCLASPPRKAFEENGGDNPHRRESYEQAVELGKRVRKVWEGHHNFRFIGNGKSWQDKLDSVRGAVAGFRRAAPEGKARQP